VPAFLPNVVILSRFSVEPIPVNPDYYATLATAQTVCLRVKCTAVISKPCVEVSAPFTCSAMQEWLIFASDCYQVNAGPLAALWKNSPEDAFPNVAQNAAVAAIAAGRAALKPSCPATP